MLRPVRPGEIARAAVDLARKVHRSGTAEMRVREALGPLFADDDFAGGGSVGMYPGTGRPGLSPALPAMVLVLRFEANLSDREAAGAARDRISRKYALGVEPDHPGFDASVLAEFRAGPAEPAVRRLNRTETVGEGLRVALGEIAAVGPGFVVPLPDVGRRERYGHRFETARLLGRGSSETSMGAPAGQVGADGKALLDRIDADRAAGRINRPPSVRLPRVLWEQRFTAGPGGAPVLEDAADPAPSADRPYSVHDPDARYSTEGGGGGDDPAWVGAEAQLEETCDEDPPHLITDVRTTAATDPDVTATTAIQHRLIARGPAPGEHLMDAGCPSAANIAAPAAAGITLIAPVTVLTGRDAVLGTFTTTDFEVDRDAGQTTCPSTRIF